MNTRSSFKTAGYLPPDVSPVEIDCAVELFVLQVFYGLVHCHATAVKILGNMRNMEPSFENVA